MIPITVDQIDSVLVFTYPQIINGEFTEKGKICFYTNRPQSSLSIYGRNSIGNETGDPGPYAYTEYKSSNVDRLGPDYSFGLNFKHKTVYTNLHLSVQDHYSTDPAISEQAKHLNPEFLRGQMISPSLLMGAKILGGIHEMSLIHSTSKEFLYIKPWGSDLLYVRQLGQNIPTQSTFTHIGIKGTFKINKQWSIKYKTKTSSSSLDEAEAGFTPNFDWKMSNAYANIETIFQNNKIQNTYGLSFNRNSLKTNFKLKSNSFDYYNFYTSFRFNFIPTNKQVLGIYLTLIENDILLKSHITNYWQVNKSNLIFLNLSYSQRHIQEENSIWYWTENDYDFFEQQGVTYRLDNQFKNPQQFSTDINWSYQPLTSISVNFGAFYRILLNHYLEEQSYSYTDDGLDPSNIIIHTQQHGKIIGFQTSTKFRQSSTLRHKLYYQYQSAIAGDELLVNIWKSYPIHRLSYIIFFSPVKIFSLSAQVNVLSKSIWTNYEGLFEQSNGKYSETIDRILTIDVSLLKYFWNKKIFTSIVFRNLTNQNQILHPIGARFNLRWYVHLGLSLDLI